MQPITIAIGSNLGNRRKNVFNAIRELTALLDHIHCSRLYETRPYGKHDQPIFLNMVVCGQSSLPPHELLQAIKRLELALGRQTRERWGPREIDLDLLLVGNLVLKTPELELPHPEIQHRDFVLRPLCDLEPQSRHPILGLTWLELLERVAPSQRTIIQEVPHDDQHDSLPLLVSPRLS